MNDASTEKWLDEEQMAFIEKVKQEIRTARHPAMRQVNQDMILLYWKIGQQLNFHMEYGSAFINRLSQEIQSSFPHIKGFSGRNLRYMKKFASEITDEEILQKVFAKLPWGHNISLLDKVKSKQERIWYAQEDIQYGWSQAILVHQIESRLYQRQVEAPKITNFDGLLSPEQSELVKQQMKDPYVFDFIGFRKDMLEREFEDLLVHNVTKMLLAVDSQMRGEGDAPTIGLILCKGKNDVIAEYSLRDMTKPMGVSAYQLTQELPEALRGTLPSGKDFESLHD